MKFTNSLIKGKLLKRYKRFFADIKVNSKIITAHCPNTGSMQGLLDQGNEVLSGRTQDVNTSTLAIWLNSLGIPCLLYTSPSPRDH